jgi:hypothetical protein
VTQAQTGFELSSLLARKVQAAFPSIDLTSHLFCVLPMGMSYGDFVLNLVLQKEYGFVWCRIFPNNLAEPCSSFTSISSIEAAFATSREFTIRSSEAEPFQQRTHSHYFGASSAISYDYYPLITNRERVVVEHNFTTGITSVTLKEA